MDLASPLPALEALAVAVPESLLQAALQADGQVLQATEEQLRPQLSAIPKAKEALALAQLWLVAGQPRRGDDLLLALDQSHPAAGVIPDWWGLWTPPGLEPGSALAELRALAASYVQLRQADPQELWRSWLTPVQPDRAQLQQPALQLLLALILVRRTDPAGALEQALNQLFDEPFVAAEPALAWRLMDWLVLRLPHWDHARLKAADLNLQCGNLERCAAHLEAASEEQRQLPWLMDIAARHALAAGEVIEALQHWQRAMAASSQDPERLELFRQRAREARRGAGVLQARALLNRSETAAAQQLLTVLLQQDPQWQPLRSLLEQCNSPEAVPQGGAGGSDQIQALELQLQRLAELAQLECPAASSADERGAEQWEQFLHTALGRLALLA